jgi:hypothetical protein
MYKTITLVTGMLGDVTGMLGDVTGMLGDLGEQSPSNSEEQLRALERSSSVVQV